LADNVTLTLVKFFDRDKVAGRDTVSLSQAVNVVQELLRGGPLMHFNDPMYARALARRGVSDSQELLSLLSAKLERLRERIDLVIKYRNKVLAHCDLDYVTGSVHISPPVIRTINRLVRWVHLFYNQLSLIYNYSSQSPKGLEKRAAKAGDELMQVLERGNRELNRERLQRRQKYLARHGLREDQLSREFDPGENAPDL
jgi:hypothetical protein